MKKYVGSAMTAYAAVLLPCFIIAPVAFAGICFSVNDPATYFVVLLCLICSVVEIVYMQRVFDQLYTWVTFNDSGIKIKTLFRKASYIRYDEIKSIGIGLYVHGVLNSKTGTKVVFIYFSSEPFDEKYRLNMNLWKPSATRLKIGFDEKLYEYLLSILSPKHSRPLQRDYDDMLNSKGRYRL